MKNERKQITRITVFITSLFVIFLSVTYAFISQSVIGTKRQVITTGNLQIELEEGKEIKLENAMPMYDEVGKLQDAFHFRLINNSNYKADYTLYLADITDSKKEKLSYQDVKYYLTKDHQDVKLELLSERTDQIIDSGVIGANQVNYYDLRLWIDSNVEQNESIYHKMLSFQLIAKVTEHIPENYTITYHTGTDEVIEAQTKIENKDMILPSPTSLKDNHIFLGWSREENGTLDYSVDEPFRENFSTDLYAVWGIDYLYNKGNPFTSDTGGWTYIRNPYNTEKPTETVLFGDQYIEWSELADSYGYGRGIITSNSNVNLKYAKRIEFQYTIPISIVGIDDSGYKHIPRIQLSVLNEKNEAVAESSFDADVPNTSLAITSLNLENIGFGKVYIDCSTMGTRDEALVFRVYSIRVIY